MDKAFIKAKVESFGKSPLMEGRTAAQAKDLVNMYPEGLHITGVDWIETIDQVLKKGGYGVAIFDELPTQFVRGGYSLSRIIQLLIAEYGKEEANRQLKEDPLLVQLVEVVTSKGNLMVDYVIV